MTSWRTAAVSLLSFSSGLPFGLVMIAVPDWMASSGVSISVVGLITLAQAPWAFKVLWSPLMDRYAPPWLGRRRGWAAVAQVALFALTLMLAGVGHRPETPWVVAALAFAIAFASASQDIAVDAYAVDVLRPEEQGAAVGARIALYRAALFTSGGLAITLAAAWSWPAVNACLAFLYLLALLVTWRAPEPERTVPAPASLRSAVWEPFLGFLARHRALEILAFVVFYKFSDQLAQALIRPFLGQMGYSAFDRGFALATVGLAASALLASGDDAAKKEWLPGIAAGTTTATLALTEESSAWTADAITTTATRDGEAYRLSGAKWYVLAGHTADLILVVARTDGGVGLFAAFPLAF